MKFITVICIALCIFNVAVKAASKDEAMQAFKAVAGECLAETGASEADLDTMIKKLPATNKETKCLRACVMKKFNVLNGNGKFEKAVALKMAEIYLEGDAAMIQTVETIIDACKDIAVPDDHCEAAETYKMCMCGEAKKLGVDIM